MLNQISISQDEYYNLPVHELTHDKDYLHIGIDKKFLQPFDQRVYFYSYLPGEEEPNLHSVYPTFIKTHTFDELFKMHVNWAKEKLPLTTTSGSLIHLEKELKEVKEATSLEEKKEEYVDMIGCIITAAAKDGISPQELNIQFAKKLSINIEREWKYNGDGSYSHIKS